MSVVVVVGLCTVDLVQRVDTLPVPGEKVQSSSVELAAGGPAANAAVAVAALGGAARLSTVLGSHPLAQLAARDLAACGVDVTDVLPYRVAPPAVSAVSVRESDGERTVVSHNAAGVAAVADVDLAGAGCLLLDGHHPELALRAARSARELGVPVVLDAGSWKPVLAELLSYVDVCACSAAFTAPAELVNPVVIRTAGPDPVTWTAGPAHGSVDVAPTEVRDTVGAGDVWHGAAALAVARPGRVPSAEDLPGVIAFANRAAAVRIGHEGARSWFVPMRQLGGMTFEELVARASALMARERALLGICGAPAAGKSTLAARLVAALGPSSVHIGMDGFHLAQEELARLGRTERKGAPDTFDGAGYVNLLRRLRSRPAGEVVYAPGFRRDLEEPIAGAVPVPPAVRLVVTEGNYLLVDQPPWRSVRGLLDEVWFLAPSPDARHEWLIERHRAHGRSLAQARERTFGSDERNAVLIESTRSAADLVVVMPI